MRPKHWAQHLIHHAYVHAKLRPSQQVEFRQQDLEAPFLQFLSVYDLERHIEGWKYFT